MELRFRPVRWIWWAFTWRRIHKVMQGWDSFVHNGFQCAMLWWRRYVAYRSTICCHHPPIQPIIWYQYQIIVGGNFEGYRCVLARGLVVQHGLVLLVVLLLFCCIYFVVDLLINDDFHAVNFFQDLSIYFEFLFDQLKFHLFFSHFCFGG